MCCIVYVWSVPCSLIAHACFRPTELTTSLSGEPDATVLDSGDKEKISTPLHFASSSLMTEELLPDVSSITYHPNPLIVSASFCVLLLLNNAAADAALLIATSNNNNL